MCLRQKILIKLCYEKISRMQSPLSPRSEFPRDGTQLPLCAFKFSGTWVAELALAGKDSKAHIHSITQFNLLSLSQVRYSHFSKLLQVWGRRWVGAKERRLSVVLIKGTEKTWSAGNSHLLPSPDFSIGLKGSKKHFKRKYWGGDKKKGTTIYLFKRCSFL